MIQLANKLAERRAARQKHLPPDLQQSMDAAIYQLKKARLADTARQQGDLMPDFTLLDHLGQPYRLSEQLFKGPVVVNFFCGGWGPFSTLQLQALQQVQPEFQRIGASLVGITPQKQSMNQMLARQLAVNFPLLNDRHNELAYECGLAVKLPEEMVDALEQLGVDLPDHNDSDGWVMPMPASYVVTEDRRIEYAYIDEDFACRAEPYDLLLALMNREHSTRLAPHHA